MTQNWIRTAAVAAAFTLAVGCHHHKHDEATEATIAISEVPAAVTTAFAKDHAGATITKVEKETYKNGTIRYEVDYKTADGKTHETEYTPEGKQLDEH